MAYRFLPVALAVGNFFASSTEGTVIKGICYAPTPSKTAGKKLHQNDFMSEAAYPLWGRKGRSDLSVMKNLGANAVRTYGNNPGLSHKRFFDRAARLGMRVFPGISDYPYYQAPVESCKAHGYYCFSSIKRSYRANLVNSGWWTKETGYHPAIETVTVINEPDLKMPNYALHNKDGARRLARSILSAVDGMLSAEKEVGVNPNGRLVNFTATVSYAVCGYACANGAGLHASVPALAQMLVIKDAFKHPEKYHYKPQNDVYSAYKRRWTNSVNTFVPARAFERQFLGPYKQVFPRTPFYVAEYHPRGINLEVEMGTMIQLAQNTPGNLFRGAMFFQYQNQYIKGGSEATYGMFKLKGHQDKGINYFGMWYLVYCLEKAGNIPDAITRVYGGRGMKKSWFCTPHE